MKVFYIINPVSGAGRARKIWYENLRKVEKYTPDMTWRFTEEPLHAQILAKEACDKGWKKIVSVGGDGTLNEVVNGIMESDKRNQVYLGILSLGTGSDFIKSLGIPLNIDEMLDVIAAGKPKTIDVGYCEFTGKNGQKMKRYFINIADFGIGGETVAKVNATTKIFGGFFSFFYGTVSTLLSYTDKKVTFTIDGKKRRENITLVAMANGKFFGGGMCIAPEADMSDGLFDVVKIRDARLLDFLKYGIYIYRGIKITGDERIEYMRAKKVEALSDEEVLIDMDGEQPGKLPAVFEIFPSSLKVLCQEE